MSTRGYLHCYNPAYMHFYVIPKPVYAAFGGAKVWQTMTPEFKWVWKGIKTRVMLWRIKERSSRNRNKLLVWRLDAGFCGTCCDWEVTCDGHVYAAIRGNWDWKRATFTSALPDTQKIPTARDPIYKTQSAIRQKVTRGACLEKAVCTSVSTLKFLNFFTIREAVVFPY